MDWGHWTIFAILHLLRWDTGKTNYQLGYLILLKQRGKTGLGNLN